MNRPFQSAVLLVLALSALVFAPPPAHAAERPLVFAAASTQPVMDAVKSVLSDRGTDISVSTGGSSTLARQIQLGAGADVFVSANVKWMDYLDQRGLLEPDTRRTVATNRLAVIAGPGAASQASRRATCCRRSWARP